MTKNESSNKDFELPVGSKEKPRGFSLKFDQMKGTKSKDLKICQQLHIKVWNHNLYYLITQLKKHIKILSI